MQLIATIEDPAVIQRILAHLGLPGAREDPRPSLPVTAAGAEQPGTSRRDRLRRCRGSGQPRPSALPVPDGPVEGSPVIQDPDLTADPRSGRIGARWEGVYPHCDKAQDPRARRARTENWLYVIYGLMSKDLPENPGKEMLMITVEHAPGGSSPIHRHNAHAIVYVLEGSVVMQVKGGKQVTLTPGQTFYEGPDDVHVVDRNASSTQPAKFLVFLIKNKGAPALVPVK